MPPIVVRNVSGTVLPVDESTPRVINVPLHGEETNILDALREYKSEAGSERFVYRINCHIVDTDQLARCMDVLQQQVLFFSVVFDVMERIAGSQKNRIRACLCDAASWRRKGCGVWLYTQVMP